MSASPATSDDADVLVTPSATRSSSKRRWRRRASLGRQRTVQLGSAAACACGTATAVRLPSTSLSGRSNPMSATVVCRVGAPVGRALVCRRRGSTVAVETPRGTMQLEILSVVPVVQRAAKEAA
jgi:hypothetical protein